MSKLKIVLISFLLIIVSALTFFVYHLQASEEVVATLVFENGEANYESNEVDFSFTDSNFEKKSSIQISKSQKLDFDDDNLYFRSKKSHVLSGKISDFSGKLKITFSLTDKLINKFGSKLKENLFIIAFEESYRYPALDTVLVANFMRIKIDTKRNKAETTFDFSRLKYTDSLQNYRIAFDLICYDKKLKTKYSKDQNYHGKGNFLAINTEGIDREALDFVLDKFETQYNKIRTLNYTIRNNSKPLQVKFTNLTKNASINYIQNIYIAEKKWIEINEVPYLNRSPESLSGKEIEKLKLFSGTSIMHLALNNYQLKHWFNKAVVNWYESISLSDTSYVQEFEPSDFKLLDKAFFFKREDSDKFNSLFFSFLMRKGGFFFGSNLYNSSKQGKQKFQYNLQRTLRKKEFKNVFVEFFDVLLRKPSKLFPALSPNEILDYLPYEKVSLQVKTEDNQAQITHSESLSKGNILKQSAENILLINYELENYSASFLKIDLKSLNSETKKKFIQGEYKLKISLTGSSDMGIFVYKNIGNKLILTAEKLNFYSVNGISELEINNSGKFLISIINYDDKIVEKPELKSLTLKLEILN